MKNATEKIQSFTDLNTWKEGHKLVLMIYKATDVFPQKEQFVLVSQMRRSAISITSNIAEGFSRNTSKDKYQFYFERNKLVYSIAQGSLTELQNQLLIARDLSYLSHSEFQAIAHQTITFNKLLNGLKRIKYKSP